MECQRMCICCRENKDKRDLIRVVKNKEGEISVDFTGKKNGRGAYICTDSDCLKKLKKNKVLNKTFKCNVSDEVYDQILKEVSIGQN